jgi:hypothetical protein
MIGRSALQQLVGDFTMTVGAGELRDGVAIPFETEPFQAIEDGGDGLLVVAFAIGVLDAQQKLAVAASGIQPIEQSRAGAADVQVSCRGRCEPDKWRIGNRGLCLWTFSLNCH